MIELKNLNYNVFDKESGEEKRIIRDLSLVFPRGKITVITGHNGSGKSTLIKLLMGIIQESSGEILLDGKSLAGIDMTQRANLGMTLSFQQPVRFKGLTVRDLLNIASKEENNIPKACEFLAQVGLCAKDYIDRTLDDTLSGGELKRIELAISLCKGGDVLLFDEPEAGIDLWSFDGLVNLFKKQAGKTIIIVSHQKRILEIADFILLMDIDNPAKMGTKKEMEKFVNSPTCRNMGGEING